MKFTPQLHLPPHNDLQRPATTCRATWVDLRGIRRRHLRALALGGAEVGGLRPEAVDHWPWFNGINNMAKCPFLVEKWQFLVEKLPFLVEKIAISS